jgi:hypothetical protein
MRKGTQPERHGADGGGRTHTLSRVPDFESGASANSATSATVRQYISWGGEVNKFPHARCGVPSTVVHHFVSGVPTSWNDSMYPFLSKMGR